MKKILELGLAHHNWDSRIFYKQAVSLSNEFNIKCLWWIFSNKKWSWYEDNISNIENIWISGNRLTVLFNSLLFLFKNKSDIYVAHDIDSYLVLIIFKLFNWKSKIVFDSHEYYDLYDSSKFSRMELILLMTFSKIIKPLTIKLFSWVTVVTKDMQDFYIEVKEKKIIFNYPILDFFDLIKSNEKLSKDYFYFIYHWWISEDRGIFEMIKIFSDYYKNNSKIKFLLIWNFTSKKLERDIIESLKLKGLINNFIITWQLSLLETISYIKNDVKKIGFCLFDNVWQMSKSIPIKMLEYLSLEIPQIWSNYINSFNKIINKNNAWFSVEYWNIKDELDSIKIIFSNYEYYKNNCNKIKNNFTWKNEEIKLLEFYKKILNET